MQASYDLILGSVLNVLRRKAGVSVNSLLSDLDCSESQYVRFELGRTTIPYRSLRIVLERMYSSASAAYVRDFFLEVSEFEAQLTRLGIPVTSDVVGEGKTHSGDMRNAYLEFCEARDFAADLSNRRRVA